MEVVLRKYGNSTVAVLPPVVLKDIGLRAGQSLSLETTCDGKIVLSPKKSYSLSESMSQFDLKAKPPKDLELWDNCKPIDQERGEFIQKKHEELLEVFDAPENPAISAEDAAKLNKELDLQSAQESGQLPLIGQAR